MHSTAFTNVVIRRVIKPVVKEVTSMAKMTTATRLLLKQLGIRFPVELNKMACGKVVSSNITVNISMTSTTNTKKAIRPLKVQALRINDFLINDESPLFTNTPYARKNHPYKDILVEIACETSEKPPDALTIEH